MVLSGLGRAFKKALSIAMCLVLTPLLAIFSAQPAQAAPIVLNGPSANWVSVLNGVKFDPGQDKQAQAAVDLVGNAANTLMYMWFDDNGDVDLSNDELALRIRADEARDNQNRFTGYLWMGLDVDQDGDLDVFLMLEGKNGVYKLDVYSAGSGANTSPSTSSIQTPVALTTLTLNNTFRIDQVTAIDAGGTADVDGDTNLDDYVSFKFNFKAFADIANLKALTGGGGALVGSLSGGAGLTKNTPLRYVIASAQQTNALNGDLAGYGPGDSSSATYATQGAFSPVTALGDPDGTTIPVAITLTGPASVNAGVASSNFTLTVVNGDGNAVNVAQNTTFTLSSNSAGTVTFAPVSPVTVPTGSSSVTFTYTDSAGSATAKTVTATWASGGVDLGTATHNITVNAANNAPTFTGAATNTAQTINEGQGLTAVAATDADGDTLTYTLQSGTLPAGITLQNTGSFSGTASYTAAGNYSVVIRAADGNGGTIDTTLNITVNNVDTTPTLTAIANQVGAVGGTANLTATGADVDGDTLSYSATGLPTGVSINAATGAITGTYGAAGTFNATVTVTDNTPGGAGGDSASRAFTWTISATNAAPTFTGAATNTAQTIDEGQGLTAVAATDADGDTLTYTLQSGTLPAGITLQNTGSFSGTASYTSAGNYSVVIRAADGKGGTVDTTLAITVNNVDTTPTLAAVAGQASAPGDTANLALTGADVDGDTLTYSATGLPTGLSINAATGAITGTFGAAGTFNVTVTVTDNTPGGPGGDSASRNFTWTVTGTDTTPTLAPIPDQSTPAGSFGQVTAVGADADGDTLTYSATGLPASLSINAVTGVISGVVGSNTPPGPFNVTVTVTDNTPGGAGGDSASQSFTWNVVAVNKPPAYTAAATNREQTIKEGEGLTAVVATDPEGSPVTYLLSQGQLPPGISLNRDGTFTGKTTYQAAGVYEVKIGAVDSNGGSTITNLKITVENVDTTPTLAPIADQVSNEGDTVQLAASASDQDGDGLTFTAAGLPGGVAIDPAAGVMQGNLDYVSAGSYIVTVTVTDDTPTPGNAAADVASVRFTWKVNNVPQPTKIRGLVADGRSLDPVPGAKVVLRRPDKGVEGTRTADNDGRYEFERVQEGTYTVEFSHPGYHPSQTGVKAEPEHVLVVDGFITALPSAVRGTVTDALSGRPVEGAEITLQQGATRRSATTDGVGGYFIPEVTTGVDSTVTAALPGYNRLPAADPFQVPAGTTVTRDLALTALSGVRGQITTDAGVPAVGVALRLLDPAGNTVRSATSDESGGYVFADLPAGSFTVTIPYSRFPVSQGVVVPPGRTVRVDLQLTGRAVLALTATPADIIGDGISTSTLRAVLTLRDGTPVPNVQVELATTAGTLSTGTVVTGADGIATAVLTAPLIEGVTPRTETASAVVADPAQGLFARATILIKFLPAAIEGVITDANTRRPVAGAKVEVREDFDGDGVIDFAAETVTGPDGRYRMVVPRGNWNYRLRVTAPVQVGNRTVMLTSTQFSPLGRLQGIGEKFKARNKISGQVLAVDPGGQQLLQVSEILSSGQHLAGLIRTADGVTLDKPVVVAADGSYEVDDVDVGQYYIVFQVTAADGRKLAGTAIRVNVTESGELSLQTPLIDPYGTVTDAVTGQPVPDVKITLYWADTPLNRGYGRIPDTVVPLPVLADFPPNQNRNPQFTSQQGKYAWMVFADGDYYMKTEKAGYQVFDSRLDPRNVPPGPGEDSYIKDGIIHVGQTIVLYDVTITPIGTGTGTGGGTTAGTVSGGTTTPPRVPGSGLGVLVPVGQPLPPPPPLPLPPAPAQVLPELGSHTRYILGYPDGQFKPERNITRAEVATILTRILNVNPFQGMLPPFPDVSGAAWYAGYIEAAKWVGAMQGDPDGNFRPDAPITRAEVAVIGLRFKRLTPEPGTPFADTTGHWAEAIINAAAQAKLVQGFPDSSYRPQRPASRAEFVTIINRILARGPLQNRPEPRWPDVPFTYWAAGHVEEASANHLYTRMPDGVELWRGDAAAAATSN